METSNLTHLAKDHTKKCTGHCISIMEQRTLEQAVLDVRANSDAPLGPSEIAKQTGSTPGSISQLRRSLLAQNEITKKGRGSYILPGQDDGSKTEAPAAPRGGPPVAERATAYIPFVTIRANGGNGEEAIEEQVACHVACDSMQLRRSGLDPERMVLIPVSGNSMYPTRSPGDEALGQIYGRAPVQDSSVYVLKRRHHGGIIKRIFRNQKGELGLRSDNPEGATRKIPPGSRFE